MSNASECERYCVAKAAHSAAIGAVPSFRARGAVQELGLAAAGSRLRGRISHDSPAAAAAARPAPVMASRDACIDVTPLGMVRRSSSALSKKKLQRREGTLHHDLLMSV